MALKDHTLKYYKASDQYKPEFASRVLESYNKMGLEEIKFLNPQDKSYYYIYLTWKREESHTYYAYHAKISEKIYNNLEKLIYLKKTCYIESLNNLPTNIRRLITDTLPNHSIGNSPNLYAKVELYNGCICITTSVRNDVGFDNYIKIVYKQNCLSLLQTIEDIKEGYKNLNKSQFDKLKYKPIEDIRKQEQDMPKWASNALKIALRVGTRVGLGIIGGFIGANIFNGDGDIDFDFGDSNIDVGDMGVDLDDLSLDNTDFSDIASPDSSNSISFRSTLPPNHSSDGFIFQGGETYKGHDVYKKGVHTYYWDAIKEIFVLIK